MIKLSSLIKQGKTAHKLALQKLERKRKEICIKPIYSTLSFISLHHAIKNVSLNDKCLQNLLSIYVGSHKDTIREKTGIYIMQNTMVEGGG